MNPHDKVFDPNDSIDFIYRQGKEYAIAKSELLFLEEFKKVKLAMLMKNALVNGHKSVAAQEREALSDVEYVTNLNGIKAASEKSISIYWGLVAAQARLDVWRSQEASNRMMDKITT
jgi:hypothetical protein